MKTEQIKNEALEKKWMGEFDNKFSSQWSSETDNCGEYISGSRAIAWQVYLSARKAAQVEIDSLLNQISDYTRRNEDDIKDRDQEISKLRSVNDSLILSSNSLTEQRDRLNEKNDSLEQEISRLKEEIDKKRGVSGKY